MYIVSRTETFAKLFFVVSFTGLFMYVALAFYSFHTAYTTMSQTVKYQERFNKLRSYDEVDERFENDLKYILVWSAAVSRKAEKLLPYEGQSLLIENNCPVINCYITTNTTILNNDYTNFHAIVFNMTLLPIIGYGDLPKNRTKSQKYVFYGMQGADDHPICNTHLDNFFNWTWSYKFSSDIFSPFIEVKDMSGNVVAPSRKVLWTTHLKPTTKREIIQQVNTKTKAITLVIEDCDTVTKNKLVLFKLTRALKLFNLSIDVYGCGFKNCPREGCLKAIEKDYYFYLAFEACLSEDFVTTEVLKGYHHDAVPVVVGGADYTKFLPENSYINFNFYNEEKLAALLDFAIRNPTVYHQYFNWKNYYTIEKVDEIRGYCELCKMLNDKKEYQAFSTYRNFRTWWHYGPLREKCLPKGAEMLSEIWHMKDLWKG